MGRDTGDSTHVKFVSNQPAAACVAFVLILLLTGCASVDQNSAAAPSRAPVLLISLDGFRWDYIAQHPEATPNLRQLMQDGVSARGLIPVFPSQTFTNHYSIATGLYPAHHGIISNIFFDPELGEYFRYKTPSATRDARWWGGEPIWITAVKQGRKSACYFWPGSEVVFAGIRATIAMPFDYSVPFADRLDRLFSWFARPANDRPAIALFYFEETNKAGHYFGPNSAELVSTVKMLDEQIGAIVRRSQAEQIPLNFVIVSDHGFIATDGATMTAMIDDYVDFTRVQVDFDGPTCGLRPLDGDTDALLKRLQALPPQYKVYQSKDLPARWQMRDNQRIPPVWIVPEAGWRIQRRSTYLAVKDFNLKGDHGFDPQVQAMHGIFIASGPAFQTGRVIDAIENVHIYNLLCATLEISAAPNDGDDRLVRSVLKNGYVR